VQPARERPVPAQAAQEPVQQALERPALQREPVRQPVQEALQLVAAEQSLARVRQQEPAAVQLPAACSAAP
jgi:hypothetical protein